MSKMLDNLRALVEEGSVRISDHGYDELAADDIFVRDVITGLKSAEVIGDYPDFSKGPCLLVLEYDREEHPIHAVGEFLTVRQNLPCLSRPIVLIQHDGQTISGKGNDEKQTP